MKPTNIIQHWLHCIIFCHVCANPNTESTNFYEAHDSPLAGSNDNVSMSASGWKFHRPRPVSDFQNTSRVQSVNQNPLRIFYNHQSPSFEALIEQLSKSPLATFEPLNVSYQLDLEDTTTNRSGFPRRVEPIFNFSWVNIDKPKFPAKKECYIDNEALFPRFSTRTAQKILSTSVGQDIGENGLPKYFLELNHRAMLFGYQKVTAELIYQKITFIITEIISLTLEVNAALKRVDNVSNNHDNNSYSTNAYIDRNLINEFKPFVENHRIRLNLYAMQIESWKHLMIVYYSRMARYPFKPNSTKYGCNEATLLEHVRLMNISKIYAQHSTQKTNIYSSDISGFALRFQLDCINYILRYVFVNAMKKSKQYELRVQQQILEHEHPFGVQTLTNPSWIESDVEISISSTGLKQECYDYFLSIEYQTKLEKYRIWIEKVYHNSGFSQNGALISNNVSIWHGVPNTIPKWISIIINIDDIYDKKIEIGNKISLNFTRIIRKRNKRSYFDDTSLRTNVGRRQPQQNKTDSGCNCCQVM